jgi:hypothetical protein
MRVSFVLVARWLVSVTAQAFPSLAGIVDGPP